MVKTLMPPGFRFHPTDVELVVYYLKRKVMGKKLHFNAIAEIDVYKNAPWDLPDKSCLKTKDLKWYFFCATEKKYTNGARMKRATDCGYWKATGKDRPVSYEGKVVGLIKTLVFHQGKPPKGTRTDWIIHEYRLEDKDLLDKGVVQDAFVLSVVFQKEGIGPRNGAQYGAPFMEEDWSDDEEIDCGEAITFVGLSMPPVIPHNQTVGVTATKHPSESICNATPSESYLSDSQISSLVVLPSLHSVSVDNHEDQIQKDNDMDLLLAQFTEERAEPGGLPADCEAGRIEKHFDPEDFFDDLDLDLHVLADLGAVNLSTEPALSGYEDPYRFMDMLPNEDPTFIELLMAEDSTFIELFDLDNPPDD